MKNEISKDREIDLQRRYPINRIQIVNRFYNQTHVTSKIELKVRWLKKEYGIDISTEDLKDLLRIYPGNTGYFPEPPMLAIKNKEGYAASLKG